MKTYDCVIIGGGPAGMTAALYALRSGMSLAWVERMAPGGQVLLTEAIENYPGFPKGVKGYELADIFSAGLEGWEFDRYLESCDELDLDADGKEHLIRAGEEWIKATTVIITTGAEYKKLGLPREEELVGKGISYCALCDGNFFRDQVVAVVGGGNSALEEALYLTKLVKKLYLIHRRDEFRACAHYQNKCVIDPKMELLRSTIVTGLEGGDQLTGITLENVKTGESSVLNVDGLFIFVGFQPLGDFLSDDLDLDDKGFVITDTEMRTNIPGVFAAGDIRSKLCRQVATAVGDGATAANSAFLYMESFDA